MAGRAPRCLQPVENKLALLTMIKRNKKVLFGKFSTELENIDKVKGWEEILTKAKALQMVTAERTWTYVRDQLYGMWKTRALEKRDNASKTGTSGGKQQKITEVDLLIYDIIGKDTPTLNGVEGSESGRGRNVSCVSVAARNTEQSTFTEESGPSTAITNETMSSDTINCVTDEQEKSKKKKKKNHVEIEEIISKKRKIQIDVLQLEAYKIKLECYKLEKELYINHSVMTKDLMEQELFIDDL